MCQKRMVWVNVVSFWYVLPAKEDHHPACVPKHSRIKSHGSGITPPRLSGPLGVPAAHKRARSSSGIPDSLVVLLLILNSGVDPEQWHSLLRNIWCIVFSILIKCNPPSWRDRNTSRRWNVYITLLLLYKKLPRVKIYKDNHRLFLCSTQNGFFPW